MLTGPQLDALEELARRARGNPHGQPVTEAVCRELLRLGLAYELAAWQWRPTPNGLAALNETSKAGT